MQPQAGRQVEVELNCVRLRPEKEFVSVFSERHRCAENALDSWHHVFSHRPCSLRLS